MRHPPGGYLFPAWGRIFSMTVGQVTYYDYEHCREFLETRARTLRETARGLETLALFRELFYSFSYEALEQGALTLGQFDTGVVYLFLPGFLQQEKYQRRRDVARAKALELLGCSPKEPPLVLDLLTSQSLEPPVGERGRMERWMRSEFLNDVLRPGRIHIHLYFDGGAFFREILVPQLEQRGFTLLEDYIRSARNGELRVRHAAVPGKLFRLPWMLWIREMMGGGYSVVYLMACVANYLQKLEAAVADKAGKGPTR